MEEHRCPICGLWISRGGVLAHATDCHARSGMLPEQIAHLQSAQQRERRDRGESFQEEIRRSWRLVPNVWRRRIVDGEGGSQPADELVLTTNGNILAEHKRTTKNRFDLSFLRPNQIKGLLDFDSVLPQNYGLVFVSMQNADLDETYAIRLLTAIQHMRKSGRKYVSIAEMVKIGTHAPLIDVNGERAYNLQGVVAYLRSM